MRVKRISFLIAVLAAAMAPAAALADCSLDVATLARVADARGTMFSGTVVSKRHEEPGYRTVTFDVDHAYAGTRSGRLPVRFSACSPMPFFVGHRYLVSMADPRDTGSSQMAAWSLSPSGALTLIDFYALGYGEPSPPARRVDSIWAVDSVAEAVRLLAPGYDGPLPDTSAVTHDSTSPATATPLLLLAGLMGASWFVLRRRA
jgi:hypothetical protein